jgi:glucokinase
LTSRSDGGESGMVPGGFVVMSGLPASGKSRLGAAIAPLLDLPLLDKDDFLETLFERDGTGDAAWRERLSRRSDDLLRTAAFAAKGAVLASFWRHPGRLDGGGTPSEWLRELPGALIEVHCRCPAGVALERFRRRHRHPGHLDAKRRGADLTSKFDGYAARGPLGLGTVITIDTSNYPDAAALAARIRRVLGAGGG